jgi:hypothetical protein
MKGETEIMEYDMDKVDEVTLALLYLVMHDEEDSGARAWKGFDWDTMDRLHDKGFIGNPINKARSVTVSAEGYKRAKELFEKHFARRHR